MGIFFFYPLFIMLKNEAFPTKQLGLIARKVIPEAKSFRVLSCAIY